MTAPIALADARLHLANLIEHAVAGAEIVVSDGAARVRLVPVARPRSRRTLQAGFNDPPSAQVQWAERPSRQAA
jgi:antitoxin (DNA-binding transcriptional repressor) of toxin-antitoxin stability system